MTPAESLIRAYLAYVEHEPYDPDLRQKWRDLVDAAKAYRKDGGRPEAVAQEIAIEGLGHTGDR